MNIKQLEYFIDLTKTLNFTKTAQNFYISQTAITKQIQCLENDLGIPLFHRTKKSVSLTHEGEFFLTYAQKILDDISITYQSIEQYKEGLHGELRLGFINSLDDELLIQFLQKIKTQFPYIYFHFKSYSRFELINLFKNKKLDFIITFECTELENDTSLLLKKSHLNKYYHKNCQLKDLKLIHDVRNVIYEDSEIEQTLLRLCLKEGYAILHDFIYNNQYAKYLQYQSTNIISNINLYYHPNSLNQCLHQIINYIKNDNF